jgi:beta-aspartyl-peptidase (threonine type)
VKTSLLPLALALAPLACRSESTLRAEVVDLLEAQVRDWNEADLEGFLGGYLRSPSLTFYGGGTVVSGFDALRERYERNYRAPGKEMGRLAFHDLAVDLLASDAAVVRGRWEVRTSKETLGGLFTLLVRRLRGGWHIVHDHTSS